MTVAKVRDDDYIHIMAELGPFAEGLKAIQGLTDVEKARGILHIRLELSRLGIGYQNLVELGSRFNIFKRIPISESLTEHEFIGTLEEVEAAVKAASIVFELGIQRDRSDRIKTQISQPESASRTQEAPQALQLTTHDAPSPPPSRE